MSIEMNITFTWLSSLYNPLNITPKTFKCYADDSHTRFDKQQPRQFLEILNKQDTSIHKLLNFLDITISNNRTDSYDFKIFRKPAITNVQIKSNSNMAQYPIFLFQYLKGSYQELTKFLQNIL